MYRVSDNKIQIIENLLKENPIELEVEKFQIPNQILKKFVDDMKNDINIIKKAVVLFSIMAKINACVYVSKNEKISLSQKVISAMKEKNKDMRNVLFNKAYTDLIKLYTKYQKECFFEELDLNYISLFPYADEMLNNTAKLISESALHAKNLSDYIYSPLKMAYYFVTQGICLLSDNHILDIIQSTLIYLDYTAVVYTTASIINKFITILCSNRSLMSKLSSMLNLGASLKIQYSKSKEKEIKKVEQTRKKLEIQEQKKRGADKTILRPLRYDSGALATSRWIVKRSLLNVRNNVVDELKDVGLTQRQAEWTTDLSLGGLVSSTNYKGILEYIKYKKYQVSKEMMTSAGKNGFMKEVLKSIGMSNVGRPPKEVTLNAKTLFMIPNAGRLLGVGFVICKLHKEELQEYSKTITEPIRKVKEKLVQNLKVSPTKRTSPFNKSFSKRTGPPVSKSSSSKSSSRETIQNEWEDE